MLVILELTSVLTVLDLNAGTRELAIVDVATVELSVVPLPDVGLKIAIDVSVALESVRIELEIEEYFDISDEIIPVIVDIKVSVFPGTVDDDSEVISTGVVSGVLIPMVELKSGQ